MSTAYDGTKPGAYLRKLQNLAERQSLAAYKRGDERNSFRYARRAESWAVLAADAEHIPFAASLEFITA